MRCVKKKGTLPCERRESSKVTHHVVLSTRFPPGTCGALVGGFKQPRRLATSAAPGHIPRIEPIGHRQEQRRLRPPACLRCVFLHWIPFRPTDDHLGGYGVCRKSGNVRSRGLIRASGMPETHDQKCSTFLRWPRGSFHNQLGIFLTKGLNDEAIPAKGHMRRQFLGDLFGCDVPPFDRLTVRAQSA